MKIHKNFNIHKIFITNNPTKKNSIILEDNPIFQINDILEITEEKEIITHISHNSNDNSLLVNNHCNLRCINCPQTSTEKIPNLRKKNFEIIDLLNKSINKIGLTGGEPTLNIDYLIEIIEKLYKKNNKIRIDILSNANNLGDATQLFELIMIKKIDITFCVALYADIPEIHDKLTQVKGSFWRTIKALHYMAYYNQKIELRFIINKLNYTRLPSFINFTYNNLPYIKRLALIGMEYSGFALKNAEQLYIKQSDYNLQLIDAIKAAKQRNIPIFIFNHQVCKLDIKIWKYCVPTISDWKTYYLPHCNFCTMRDICGGFFATTDPTYLDEKTTPIIYKVKEH
ncbi:MAG: His-Xaa-Ser system radical SAM maturase HxsC [Sphaerochaetaceae bacterium]|nr:His-Xaa-Ser system radical SAM maturase HxsC [Sphaerochaetaceae bacterium]